MIVNNLIHEAASSELCNLSDSATASVIQFTDAFVAEFKPRHYGQLNIRLVRDFSMVSVVFHAHAGGDTHVYDAIFPVRRLQDIGERVATFGADRAASIAAECDRYLDSVVG